MIVSFKAYDLDGNGYITKDELAEMFKSAWISGFRALSATHGNEELSREDLEEFSEEMATLFAGIISFSYHTRPLYCIFII